MEYIVSGRPGHVYTELFERALAVGPFSGISSAVAYATLGGVKLLEDTLRGALGTAWEEMDKKWLVGIDWCRSDPPALDRLDSLKNSKVKVPDGDIILSRTGCMPSRTYHPKLFMFIGDQRTAIICGSGNLSRNGLSRGCEIGSVITLDNLAETGALPHPEAGALLQWFHVEWRRADRYDAIARKYEAACRDRVRRQAIVPTDDDAKPTVGSARERGRALTEEQIHELRTFENFWIDAGALGANLGAGIPGNQLDMKRYTRAYFGAGIDNLAPETEIDHITLVWDGVRHTDRTLKYGDNHMDKLNVPPAGALGRDFYRGRALLFRRRSDGAFDFEAGGAAERRRWTGASRRVGVIHRLSTTREWGLF
jgi:hypothetical protein